MVITPAALDHPHGLRIVQRVEAAGIEVERLTANRLTGLRGADERQTYALAKSTMAIVVSPPSTTAVDRDLSACRSRMWGGHRLIISGCVDF